MYKQIYLIIKDGIISLLKDVDGNKRKMGEIIFSFFIIPLIITISAKFLNINISEAIETLLTCLSIFTTLIFGILFTVPEKLSQRIDTLNETKDDASQNYLIRFSNFSKGFVQRVSFVVIICLLLIILLIIQKIYDSSFITLIIIYFFGIIFMLILLILSDVYILLKDEIEISKKKIRDNNLCSIDRTEFKSLLFQWAEITFSYFSLE